MRTSLASLATVMLLASGACTEAKAQLAITEVMAQGTPACITPDYWELTNFGTNDINLDGYTFMDNEGKSPAFTDPFANLVLRSGKSVIFLRCQLTSSITNASTFNDWWG